MRRTELIINGTSVDLSDDISVPLTYAISDIKNPDSRNGSFSKSVTLPGSPIVDKLFNHIFDVNHSILNTTSTNFNPDFNPNLKASIVVTVDTIEQFRGYMRMRSIDRNRQNLDQIMYKVELYGELGNLIQLMGDSKLSDLTFTEYNHVYNRTNQKASWTVNYLQGYYYPMIQYGETDGLNWKVENFYPAIYAKQYWDKMFAFIGCFYSGSFANASPFTNLVVPFTSESFKLSQAQTAARKFNATKTTATAVTDRTNFGALFNNPVIFDSEVSDPDSQYNPATGKFTCVDRGKYEFVFSGQYRWEAVGGDVNPLGSLPDALSVFFYHERGSTVTMMNSANIINDITTTLFDTQRTAWVAFTYTSDTIQLDVGDVVYVKILPQPWISASTWAFLKFELDAGSDFYNTVNDPAIFEGNTLDMSGAIPDDIRMADFFLSIVKEFNLMIEPDRTMPNTYRIDTANDFYGTGSIRRWGYKLDESKQVELLPMGALDFRRLVLKRADSDDYYNKTYREEWGETYGMKKYDVTNDFLKNTSEFESIFTDTPLVGRNSDDRVYPAIFTLDSSGNPSTASSGIRLLYAGGAVNTSFAWNYVTVSGTNTETTFPYAGHLDSVATPTLDLCFATPKEVFYNAVNYTDNNLWNKYHSKFITEITDKDSKILIAYFYLKPLDILLLSFRDLYYIEVNGVNAYYRLQRVVDYDPTKEQTTKVQFLKIKNASVFVPTTYSISNYLNSTTNIVVTSRPRNPLIISGSVLDAGNGNTSSERNSGSIVGGYNNRLGVGAERIGIIGSSGVDVFPEVMGSVAIASNDVTITEDNELWIGGQRFPKSTDVFTVTTSQSITGIGVYYCTGTLTLTLSTSVLNANDVLQIFNMGVGTVTVAGGGINILYSAGNAVASFNMTGQYDSLTLRYNGTNYIMQ